eukprot:comp10950_c0_seq1/m.5524 comp10950_c0_seq1/g.5524  ORF comp10950_c0_seq1/g.5524 comp10950_c0_seq1/m.5524 type:complete len:288 (-) comp10950_c0_seq1:677-1540(-)
MVSAGDSNAQRAGHLMAGREAQYALVRRLAGSMATGVCDFTEHTAADPFNIERARMQQQKYIDTVRSIVPTVIEVAADEAHPDCCFIEDTMVVVGDTAVVNHMGHPSRRGEVKGTSAALSQVPSIKHILHMEAPATCDGGDVLNTGNHLLVGMTARTNEEGLHFLQKAFPDVNVVAVPVDRTLHLKCLMTALEPGLLVAGDTPHARSAIEAVQKAVAPFEYTVVFVPDAAAGNVLRLPNDTLIVPAHCPDSVALIRQAAPHLRLIELDMGEAAKMDGALTCQSVMIV